MAEEDWVIRMASGIEIPCRLPDGHGGGLDEIQRVLDYRAPFIPVRGNDGHFQLVNVSQIDYIRFRRIIR